ncbi:PAS domain-containing protein [Kiloniella sp. EL199]|uniref:PAS domain-containing protein n=1 Tax=Kiloniella sp. EL199 TaxID=2107581 RepID=UPI000EA3BE5E|nr:PAS domain-containing protein [Kiloniella sp. EL199]
MAKTFDIVKVLEVTEQNLKSVAQANLYRYWLDLKADKELPVWSDFNPGVVRESLPDIMLFDSHNDANFFVSITGDNCRENFGIKASRLPLEKALPENAISDAKSRLTHVYNTRKPHLVAKEMRWETAIKKELQQQSYTILFLPFDVEHDTIKLKILNSLYFG